MVKPASIILGIGAVSYGIFKRYLKPKIDQVGIFKNVSNYNNEKCSKIVELEACEDIFVDQVSELAYLACSQRPQRTYWTPALNLLQQDKLLFPSQDYIAILDLKTWQVRRVELANLPHRLAANGFRSHGLDIYVHGGGHSDQQKSNKIEHQLHATLYIINHDPPSLLNSSSISGAKSVVEVFDTVLGDSKATYRTTIEDELIQTPNNLIGIDENSFYVTNDHAKKVHWKRHLEPLVTDSQFNSVIYCSFSAELLCQPALHTNYAFPNGIARGPENSLYLATTIDLHLRVFDIQPNHTLVSKSDIKLPSMPDNIYVTETGSVFLATIPNLWNFVQMIKKFPSTPVLNSPTEIWKVSNFSKSDQNQLNAMRSSDGNFKIEKVFGDDGRTVSGTTAVAVWNSKLIMTGLASPYVSVCEINPEMAE